MEYEEIEVWKSIPGWPYKVSDKGRVMRYVGAKGTSICKILYQHTMPKGYKQVSLCRTIEYKQHQVKTFLVHKLMTLAFLGPTPEGYETNHKNFDKSDNRLENLEFVTKSENFKHALLHKKKKDSLIPQKVLKIKRLLRFGFSLKETAKCMKCSVKIVRRINNKETWGWLHSISEGAYKDKRI